MSVFYCGEFETYDEAAACIEQSGGNNAAILVRLGATIDPSSEASVLAAIAAGDAKYIPLLKIGMANAEAVRVDSNVGCQPQSVANYNRSLTLIDGKVTEQNIQFWDEINGVTGFRLGMVIVYNCSENEQMIIQGQIIIVGSWINPESDEETQRFEFTLEWKSKASPTKSAPNPIFTN